MLRAHCIHLKGPNSWQAIINVIEFSLDKSAPHSLSQMKNDFVVGLVSMWLCMRLNVCKLAQYVMPITNRLRSATATTNFEFQIQKLLLKQWPQKLVYWLLLHSA